MFGQKSKDDEILTHLTNTETSIKGLIGLLSQKLNALNEKVDYLAAAEEARATHSKKPTRKAKTEEAVTNEAV